MKLFDRIIGHTTVWLDRLDHERDVAIRAIARDGRRPALVAWLDQLETERHKHVELITKLEALRAANHPALIFASRPRHVGATWRAPRKAVS